MKVGYEEIRRHVLALEQAHAASVQGRNGGFPHGASSLARIDELMGDFFLNVARGKVDGHQSRIFVGFNPDLDVGTQETLWRVGGDYVFPLTGSVIDIVSTSANDDIAGPNARTVLVDGLDVNYERIQEVVALSGLGTSTTVQQFFRINRAVMIQAASSTVSNAGDITFTHRDSGNILRFILAGSGLDETLVWTSPLGEECYLYLFRIDVPKTGASPIVQATISFAMNNGSTGLINPFSIFANSDNPTIFLPPIPARFEEKTDFQVIVGSDTNNTPASGFVQVIFVETTA